MPSVSSPGSLQQQAEYGPGSWLVAGSNDDGVHVASSETAFLWYVSCLCTQWLFAALRRWSQRSIKHALLCSPPKWTLSSRILAVMSAEAFYSSSEAELNSWLPAGRQARALPGGRLPARQKQLLMQLLLVSACLMRCLSKPTGNSRISSLTHLTAISRVSGYQQPWQSHRLPSRSRLSLATELKAWSSLQLRAHQPWQIL